MRELRLAISKISFSLYLKPILILLLIDSSAKASRETYSEQCSVCHGTNGAGPTPLIDITEKYSAKDLIDYIVVNMPPQNPDSCNQSCAEKLVQFFDKKPFYRPPSLCRPEETGSVGTNRRLRLLGTREIRNIVNQLTGNSVKLEILNELPVAEKNAGFRNSSALVADVGRISAYIKFFDELIKKTPKDNWVFARSSELAVSAAKLILRRSVGPEETSEYNNILKIEGFRSLLAKLFTHPSFFYRQELGSSSSSSAHQILSPTEIVNLMAFDLWGHGPTEELIDLAQQSNQIYESSYRMQLARKMLNQPAARKRLQSFVYDWLQLDKPIHSELSVETKEDLRTEVMKFFEFHAFERQANFSTLLTARESPLNNNLRQFYGIASDPGAGWKITKLPRTRKGLLGRAFFPASGATNRYPHPVKRGLFIRSKFLCQEFPPPPEGAELDPVRNPDATTREVYEDLHSASGCESCHSMIDPIGFALGHFDAKGFFNNIETTPSGLQREVDAKGSINGLVGPETMLQPESPVNFFSGYAELGEILAETANVRACFARKYLTFSKGNPLNTMHNCELESFGKTFKTDDTSILDLIANIVGSEQYVLRAVESQIWLKAEPAEISRSKH